MLLGAAASGSARRVTERTLPLPGRREKTLRRRPMSCSFGEFSRNSRGAAEG